MSEHKISLALERLFQKHRIVFWYDNKHEFRKEFEFLSLPDVEKIEIINNEFGVKYRILREQPQQKFLLYRDDCQPSDFENWLLDVQLAQGEFRTDLVAIWLSELELGLEFSELVQTHSEFFQAVKRKETLKSLLNSDDTSSVISLKMLAVCAGCEPRIESILENLFQELAENRSEKIKLIERCHLDDFFWEQLARLYDYYSSEKSLKDFLIRIFQDCYEMAIDEGKYLETRKLERQEKHQPSKMSQDIQVFVRRWKDSRQFEQGFETLSDEVADLLGIEDNLSKRDFRQLINLDYFRLIDKKIISDLVQTVALNTVKSSEVGLWIRQRRQSHWFNEFEHLYEAIDYAAQFLNSFNEVTLTMNSLVDGVQCYSRTWFKLDQLYRKFIYHVRMSSQISLMGILMEKIENLYANNFLLKVNNEFQHFVDNTNRWDASPIPLQKNFFERWVQPFLKKENKVCVIISDAMRYEIGDELLSLIRQEDRYNAELEACLSMLPSYTQLGMAALLPNTTLEMADNETSTVLVNGVSSQGTANRTKILKQAIAQRATACKSDELMSMKGDEMRSLIRDHDVIYIYHNRIDATGDKRESEERVFEAVEETLQDLIRLIKKLTSANINNLLVTADHGFIYQNRAIEDSDFSNIEAQGDKILFKDRRFILGKNLIEVQGLRKFMPSQLGLVGTVEVQIPKSINRLRLKGSGSRFVHGGASLQEIVIPVLKINKKRQSDTAYVEVEILRGASSIITSGQLAVAFYQISPVTDKIQSRILRAGIYTESGELISDCHELKFDFTEDNPRQREIQIRFLLTRKADDVNNQEVILKLEENHTGTSHYKEYKSVRYVIRRSFTSDFDF